LHSPGASRAVGSAVGSNPVSWLIPCHRVIRSTGELGGYAWGIARKKVMLLKEQMTDGRRRTADDRVRSLANHQRPTTNYRRLAV
jgi:alkylated DNA nucleotide flippase Atl1